MNVPRAIRKALFAIDPIETTFARRGFAVTTPERVMRLERVGGCFVAGYVAALEEPRAVPLANSLDRAPAEVRGFHYEGAGMALALLDLALPGGGRVRRFLSGPGDPHTYMVHIGVGWAWARLGWLGGSPSQRRRELDPMLGWLAYDGYGFHEAYFYPKRVIDAGRVPRAVRGYARRVFDTGVGRALWFAAGADPDGVADRIERLPPQRHADLFAGAALACSYAGGVPDACVERLRQRGWRHAGAMAQGAAFAATARLRAGTPAEHTRRAVERFCATSEELVAKQCGLELAALGPRAAAGEPNPGFAQWREALRAHFDRASSARGAS